MSRIHAQDEDALSDSSDSSSSSEEGRFYLTLTRRHGPGIPEPGLSVRTAYIRDQVRDFYSWFHSSFYGGQTLTDTRLEELNLIRTHNITNVVWAERQLLLFEEWAEAEVAAEREALAELVGQAADEPNLSSLAATDGTVRVFPGPADGSVPLADNLFSGPLEFESGPLSREEQSRLDSYLRGDDPFPGEEV